MGQVHGEFTASVGGSAPPSPVYENPAHKERIIEWIKSYWKHGPCPVCESDNWEAGPVYEVRSFAPGGLAVPRSVLPVFSISCKTCGYVLFIDAVMAGVVHPSEEGMFQINRPGSDL